MIRLLFELGYWLLHLSGMLPVALVSENGILATSTSNDASRRQRWKPWTIVRRSRIFELAQIGVFIYFTQRNILYVTRTSNLVPLRWCFSLAFFPLSFVDWPSLDHWNTRQSRGAETSRYSILLIATLKIVRLGKGIVATYGIATAMFRSKEIERALNDLCSLHCYIFDGVDPPPMNKFAYLMCYVATSILLDNTAPLIAEASRSSGAVLGVVLGAHYKIVTLLVETSTAVSLIYLQSAMQETNESLRRRFQRADEGRRVVRLGVSVVEKNSIDVKFMLEDCRKTRRTVREIVHRLGSLHGVQWMTTVITNQMSCLLYAYACFSVILENRDRTFDDGERWRMFMLLISCSWCFVKVCVIFHAFEMIVKEIQITAFHVASLDASSIDRPSKLAALEFLEEIRGDEVRFVACSYLSMDHPDLYGVLNDTVNYIIVVLQYLNV